MVIFAPETPAPLGSETVPTMLPLMSWLRQTTGKVSRITAKLNRITAPQSRMLYVISVGRKVTDALLLLRQCERDHGIAHLVARFPVPARADHDVLFPADRVGHRTRLRRGR